MDMGEFFFVRQIIFLASDKYKDIFCTKTMLMILLKFTLLMQNYVSFYIEGRVYCMRLFANNLFAFVYLLTNMCVSFLIIVYVKFVSR